MINVSLRAASDIPNTIRTNKILYLMCDSLQGLGQLGCQAGQRGMALPDGFYSRRQALAKPVLLTPRSDYWSNPGLHCKLVGCCGGVGGVAQGGVAKLK